ncbi:MAG: acetyl-CoA decarbonylase/synthase complex subunit gamma [Elusimicrobiota bacterium]
MALTGLDIYKLLPKTNCKKCGLPTCLAFAMALASKKTSLDKCPDITEVAKQSLESASEPPIRTISVGSGENKIEIGGETVLFRHEKTFYHPCGLGVSIADTLSPEELSKKLDAFNSLVFDRVGQKVTAEFIAISNDSKNADKFASVVSEVVSKTKAHLILVSNDPAAIESALKIAKDRNPIIGPANLSNAEQITSLAKTYNAAVMASGKNIDEIAQVSQKISATGYREIVMDITPDDTENLSGLIEDLTQLRRMSIKKNIRTVGYPSIVFVKTARTDNPLALLGSASLSVAKYAGIVVLPEPEPSMFLPVVTLRQNIYTDPQKPVTVEPKLYSIGGQPNEKSPVMITTNFSLTYFTVEPEIINSKIPAWLLVIDTDGLSVLTAWAAEKFTVEKVVDSMKKNNIEGIVSHRKLILPGYVAIMSGKLNELSGWEVLVGPREASGIPKFLRTMWQ